MAFGKSAFGTVRFATGPADAATGGTASGSLTTADSTVTASASVSPVATASLTTADSTFAGSAFVSPVATASITTADSTISASADSPESTYFPWWPFRKARR